MICEQLIKVKFVTVIAARTKVVVCTIIATNLNEYNAEGSIAASFEILWQHFLKDCVP